MTAGFIKLQRKILYKRLLTTLRLNVEFIKQLSDYTRPQEVINLFDPTGSNDKRFSELGIVMRTKANINTMSDILTKIYRCINYDANIAHKIDARRLLCAWMIVAFPEFIMGKTKNSIVDTNEYPNDVYFIASKFIKQVEELSNGKHINSNNFIKTFNQYSNAICYFLGRDKAEQINKCIGEYYDINSTLAEVMISTKYTEKNKSDTIEELTSVKNKIYKHIKLLDGSIKQENLDIYANLMLIKEKQIEDSQCNILMDDIKEKKFIFLGKIVTELKNNFVKLGGHKVEGGHNINDILDPEYIIRCITYIGFTKDNVVAYGEYMKNLINKLQAPIDITNTNNEWNTFKELDIDISEYLAKMLFFMLNEIRKIKQTILNLATLSSAGIDIFGLDKPNY